MPWIVWTITNLQEYGLLILYTNRGGRSSPGIVITTPIIKLISLDTNKGEEYNRGDDLIRVAQLKYTSIHKITITKTVRVIVNTTLLL